jgi:hypothetical protein
MDNNWQQFLDKLNQYIHSHTEIRIERNSTSIPDKIRPEFYSLFRQCQEEIVKDKYSDLLQEVRALSRNYIEIERKVSRAHYNSNDKNIIRPQSTKKVVHASLWQKIKLGLNPSGFKADCIILDPYADEFLHEPLSALARMLYDPLFDLLQGKNEIDEFQKTIDEKVKAKFRQLYQLCYAKWLILNLIKLAKTDNILKVTSNELSAKTLVKQETSGKKMEEEVPLAQKTNVIALNCGRLMHSLSNVDLLIHSKSLGKYIGIKTKYETAAYSASISTTLEQRPSLPFKAVQDVLKDNPLLIYISSNAQDASLVADKDRFWCPDLIIDIKETTSEIMPDKLSHEVLKPLIGTVIIPCPYSALKPADTDKNDVSILNVDFEASRLNHIMEKIT